METSSKSVIEFKPGGYSYIPSVFQYSGGIVASPGHEVVRVRFRRLVKLQDTFLWIKKYLGDLGLTTESIAQFDLRSPAQMSDEQFRHFNEQYAAQLKEWGLVVDGITPVARTNVCPIFDTPLEPMVLAFSYVRPSSGAGGSFQLSGSADAKTGNAPVRERAIAWQDISPEGMQQKIEYVVNTMESRLKQLGVDWNDAASTEIYTRRDVCQHLRETLFNRGIGSGGVLWTYADPPVAGLEFEMDVRGYASEVIVEL